MIDNIEAENQRFIDVVDESDQIIDSRSRSEIHAQGLIHREVHIWMYDESKSVIFQKRGLHRQSAGLLDATAGGHVNQGEEYLAAAIRETKEETGIDVDSGDLILLEKLKGEDLSKDLWGTVKNNFFRAVYIYKITVNPQTIRKERGIPGGGFQKVALDVILHPDLEFNHAVIPFVLNHELPLVVNHLKNA